MPALLGPRQKRVLACSTLTPGTPAPASVTDTTTVVPGAPRVDLDRLARRAVALRVLDQVRQGPADRVAFAAHGQPRLRRHAELRIRLERGHQRRHVDRVGGRPGRVLAGHGEQAVDQLREPGDVRLQVGEGALVGTVAGEVGGVPAQRRQRRPQLVGGVGQEPPLRIARPLQRRQHLVQRDGQLLHLVLAAGRRQAPRRVGGAADLGGVGGQLLQRAQHPAGDGQGERHRHRGRCQAGEQRQLTQPVERAVHLVGGRRDHHRAARQQVPRRRRPAAPRRCAAPRRPWSRRRSQPCPCGRPGRRAAPRAARGPPAPGSGRRSARCGRPPRRPARRSQAPNRARRASSAARARRR